jgi:tetratricopeptide (TPR) repeat protein
MVRSNKMRLGFLLIFSILLVVPVSLGAHLNGEEFVHVDCNSNEGVVGNLSSDARGWGLLVVEGMPAEAIKCFDMAIAADAYDTYAWDQKGLAHYELGDRRMAVYAYTQSLLIDPTQYSIWVRLGNMHYELSDYKNASQTYEIAFALDPYDKTLWLADGNALFYSGEYEKASEALGNAIKLDPFFYEAIAKKKLLDDLLWERQVKIITAIVIIISIPAVYIIIRRQKRKNK